MAMSFGYRCIFISCIICVCIIHNVKYQTQAVDSESRKEKPLGPLEFSCRNWYCGNKERLRSELDPTIWPGYYDYMGCACDSVCSFFGDCCVDADSSQKPLAQFLKSESSYMGLKMDHFSCLKFNSISKTDSVYVINKCPKSWDFPKYRELCGADVDLDVSKPGNFYLDLPVTGVKTGAIYRNLYCALCHGERFARWVPKIVCSGSMETSSGMTSLKLLVKTPWCFLQYVPPFESEFTIRPCLPGVKDFCRYPERVPKLVSETCKESKETAIVHRFYYSFKNPSCAMCFVGDMEHVSCHRYGGTPTVGHPRSPYSYSLLFYLDRGTKRTIHNSSVSTTEHETKTGVCSSESIFDPVSISCRHVECPGSLIFQGDRCRPKNDSVETSLPDPDNSTLLCPKIRLKETEFRFNKTHIHVHVHDVILDRRKFEVTTNGVYVCTHDVMVVSGNSSVHGYDMEYVLTRAESIVSACGICVSLLALLLTFSLYCLVKPSRTLPDNIVVSLVVALFFSNSLLLLGGFTSPVSALCRVTGVLIHYKFLTAFLWMNVMAYDTWRTFSKSYVILRGSKSRFRWYSLYAWTLPCLPVGVAFLLDVFLPTSYASPGYGKLLCWFSSKISLLIFFATPLACVLVLNFTFFTLTTVNIHRTRQSAGVCSTRHHQGQRTTLIVCVRLTTFVGLTWSLGLVSGLCPSAVLRYLFIVLNSLQGLFLCLSCLATRTFQKQLKDKLISLRRSSAASSGLKTVSDTMAK
ncbi:G-protein coupled receptor Mth2 [Aplysia californica]|uniref:G-protein coupled receptor Mth2 n=1 Tax=Aplysia californica TaxID=6500 RepID=A0ABM1VTK7_APLCA|nr:G-protein coupled receptor Mth2 [Aplysia californica]